MNAATLKSIFIASTEYVLSTMAQCTVKACKPYIKKDDIALGRLSAFITAECEENKAKGFIAMSFTTAAAVCVARSMLGEDVEDEQSLREVVGELVNILSGDARRRMSEQGVTFSGSTPSMLYGEQHNLPHGTKSPVVVIPFEVDGGKFAVEFSFEIDCK